MQPRYRLAKRSSKLDVRKHGVASLLCMSANMSLTQVMLFSGWLNAGSRYLFVLYGIYDYLVEFDYFVLISWATSTARLSIEIASILHTIAVWCF